MVTKSIMLKPRSGRPTPRMAETPSGMLNSIGLQGPGIDTFLAARPALAASTTGRARSCRSPAPASRSTPAGARLSRGRRHRRRGQHLLPERRGPGAGVRLRPARRRRGRRAVVRRAPRRTCRCSPSSRRTSPTSSRSPRACVAAGADGLSMINTLLGMVIDTETMRPALAGVTGGLSGPAIRPVAVRCVWQVREALPDVPIIGMGGVRSGADAFELVLAGASASRSAPASSTTRPRPCGSPPSCRSCSRCAGSSGSPTRWATRTGPSAGSRRGGRAVHAVHADGPDGRRSAVDRPGRAARRRARRRSRRRRVGHRARRRGAHGGAPAVVQRHRADPDDRRRWRGVSTTGSTTGKVTRAPVAVALDPPTSPPPSPGRPPPARTCRR